MNKTASKLDWLKERKDFNTNPSARAATRVLEHGHAPHGDDLYPWILREIKRGNIKLPHPYLVKGGFLALVEKELAAERELARRQALSDTDRDRQHQMLQEAWEQGAGNEDNPLPASKPELPESWFSGKDIDWNDIENADWNKLHDFHDPLKETWPKLVNDVPNGKDFWIGNDRLMPSDLKQWEKVLQDRAKRRKGVDPMHFTGPEFAQEMNTRWLPEYEDQVRGDAGEVVHRFPDRWSVRRLQNSDEAEQEGEDMGHCAGGYGPSIENGQTHLFSLRDPRNRPHATIEIEPDRWRDKGVPSELMDRHGLPDNHYRSVYADQIIHMMNEVPREWAHHQELAAKNPDGDGAKCFAIAQELRRQREESGAQPWHGGTLRQIYGKEDSEPIEPYKQRIRDWFGALPEGALPSMRKWLFDQYDPNVEGERPEPGVQPAWMQGQIGEPDPAGGPPPAPDPGFGPDDQHFAHTHHGPTHKSRIHGGVCHCPWGPNRHAWSWDESPRAVDSRHDVRSRVRGSLEGAWDLSPTCDWKSEQSRGRRVRQEALGRAGQAPARGAGALASNAGRSRDRVRHRPRLAAYNSYDEIVKAWEPALTLFGEEYPDHIEVDYVERLTENPGATELCAADLKAYADRSGKTIIVPFRGIFGAQVPGFAPYKLPDGTMGAAYTPQTRRETSRTALRDGVCPTCGDPLQGEHGTFCPRCRWSENDANIDSDPLGNPPDPTKDLHRGIQARLIPSHRWAKWLVATDDLA